jgi:transposase
MEVVHQRCCGLDVHKRTVVACVHTPVGKQTRTFGATTEQLEELGAWLIEEGVTHVAMESTGVYWQPVVRHEALFDREGMKGPLQRAVAAAR